VMMGILPLQFHEGESAQSLGLSGNEVFSILEIDDLVGSGGDLNVLAKLENGDGKEFKVTCRIDTLLELEYFRSGGILAYILDKIVDQE
jgi:aconitate hydratase